MRKAKIHVQVGKTDQENGKRPAIASNQKQRKRANKKKKTIRDKATESQA